jgi:hypothetical protein
MNKGLDIESNVLYRGQKYKILWIYDSGLCEIVSTSYQAKLVKMSDLKKSK